MSRHSTAAINAVIGSNLRRLRKRAGLSQGKLAETVGVTTQQVSKYEKGEDRISAPMLTRLASSLRVMVAELLQGTADFVAQASDVQASVAGFAEGPQVAFLGPPEDARRALLHIYDQLNPPLQDVALKQIQALLYLQVPRD